jgi:hypothetical protein
MNTTTTAVTLPNVTSLPIHDRTGLRAVGVLPSGRIVWPVLGGAPEDGGQDDNSGQDTPDADGSRQDGGQDGGNGGGNGGGQDDDGDGDDPADDGNDDDRDGKDKPRRRSRSSDPDKTARTIAAIREDYKDERAKRQQAEKAQTTLQKQLDDIQAAQSKQMDALAKALGLKKDDTPPSPEAVAKDLTTRLEAANTETETERKRADTAQDNYRNVATQLAVYLAADEHDGNPRALLDSARFLKSVAGLDPDADDFSDKIAEAIKAAVEKNDRLRKAKPRGADRSGGEMNTGAKPARRRPASMSEALNKHYSQGK